MRRKSFLCSIIQIGWILFLILSVSAKDGDKNETTSSMKPTTASVEVITKEQATTISQTTTTSKLECDFIANGTNIDTIIDDCVNASIISYSGNVIDISTIDHDRLNAFLKTKTNIDRGLILVNNQEIKWLDLGNLEKLGNSQPALTIVNTSIEKILMKTPIFDGPVIIRANKYLDKAALDVIGKYRLQSGSKDIQGPGECLIDPQNVDLTDCKRIYKNLELEDYDFVKKTPDFQPEAVSGCIKIGAKAKVSEIMFDKLIKNQFSDTKCDDKNYIRACLKKKVHDKIKSALPQSVNFEEYKREDHCYFTCNFMDLENYEQEGCTKIEGDLNIGEATKSLKKLLKNVEEIKGTIILNGTNFTKLDNIFEKLKSIESDGPAIIIANNLNLGGPILFNNLDLIKSKAKSCVVIKNNGNYKVDSTFLAQLNRVGSGCKLDLDSVPNNTLIFDEDTTVVPMTPAPTNADSGSKKDNDVNSARSNSEQSNESNTGLIVGLTIGGAILLLIIVVVIGIVLYKRHKNKAKQREDELKNETNIAEKKIKQKEEACSKPVAIHDNWVIYNEKIAEISEGIRGRICCLIESIINTPVLRVRQLVRTGPQCLKEKKLTKKDAPQLPTDATKEEKIAHNQKTIEFEEQLKQQRLEREKYGDYFQLPLHTKFKMVIGEQSKQYLHVNTFYGKTAVQKAATWESLVCKYEDKKEQMLVLCTFNALPFEKYFDGMDGYKCTKNDERQKCDSGEYPDPHPPNQIPQYYTVTSAKTKKSVTVRVHDMEFHEPNKITFLSAADFYAHLKLGEKQNAYTGCHHARYVRWAHDHNVPFLMFEADRALFVEMISLALYFIFDYTLITEPQVEYGVHNMILLNAFNYARCKVFQPPDVVHAYAMTMLLYCVPYVLQLQKNNDHFKAWQITQFGKIPAQGNEKSTMTKTKKEGENSHSGGDDKNMKVTQEAVEDYVNDTRFMTLIIKEQKAGETIKWDEVTTEVCQLKISASSCMKDSTEEKVVKDIDLKAIMIPPGEEEKPSTEQQTTVERSKDKSNDKSNDPNAKGAKMVAKPGGIKSKEKVPKKSDVSKSASNQDKKPGQ